MGLFRSVFVIAFLAWVLLRLFVIFRTLVTFGIGTSVLNHAPGPCKLFHVNGSEDIDVLPSGLAIISSGLKYALGTHSDPALDFHEGRIYGFDFNDARQTLKEFAIENFNMTDFSPHGIDIYTDPETGEHLLFVVNHGEGKESVEIFQVDEKELILMHKRTVLDENIFNPNDVVAVGPDSFYVTNDHYFHNSLLAKIELFYPLKLGNVVFYNGKNATVVIPSGSMAMPNGINIDGAGKYVFVVDVVGGNIHVFKRMDDNSLEKKQELPTGVPFDNIFVDEMGDLWSGGTTIAILEYYKNFSKPCPSKVYQMKLAKLDKSDEPPFKIEDMLEVYSTNGEKMYDLKAASSAVFYKGKLLIGTVYGNLMYCDVIAV